MEPPLFFIQNFSLVQFLISPEPCCNFLIIDDKKEKAVANFMCYILYMWFLVVNIHKSVKLCKGTITLLLYIILFPACVRHYYSTVQLFPFVL